MTIDEFRRILATREPPEGFVRLSTECQISHDGKEMRYKTVDEKVYYPRDETKRCLDILRKSLDHWKAQSKMEIACVLLGIMKEIDGKPLIWIAENEKTND